MELRYETEQWNGIVEMEWQNGIAKGIPEEPQREFPDIIEIASWMVCPRTLQMLDSHWSTAEVIKQTCK